MNWVRTRIVALDKSVDKALSEMNTPGLRRIMEIATVIGSAYCCFPIYAVALAFAWKQVAPVLAPILWAEGILFPLIVILRLTIRRERPSARDVRGWEAWNRFSFPSYHAARIWVIALAISSQLPHLMISTVSMAMIVCASRLVLHRHYLSDVLAGSLIGGLAYHAAALF